MILSTLDAFWIFSTFSPSSLFSFSAGLPDFSNFSDSLPDSALGDSGMAANRFEVEAERDEEEEERLRPLFRVPMNFDKCFEMLVVREGEWG